MVCRYYGYSPNPTVPARVFRFNHRPEMCMLSPSILSPYPSTLKLFPHAETQRFFRFLVDLWFGARVSRVLPFTHKENQLRSSVAARRPKRSASEPMPQLQTWSFGLFSPPTWLGPRTKPIRCSKIWDHRPRLRRFHSLHIFSVVSGKCLGYNWELLAR